MKQILSWYSSDNVGVKTNLARLLNHGTLAGTGKLVILPVDQGFEHGPARSFAPNPPAYDPDYHFQLAIDAGCNAYAAPLGFLEAAADKFAGQIPLILKLNNSDTLAKMDQPCSAVTGSVKDARAPRLRGHRLHDLPGLGRAQHDVRGASRAHPRGEGRAACRRSSGRTRAARASRRRASRRST